MRTEKPSRKTSCSPASGNRALIGTVAFVSRFGPHLQPLKRLMLILALTCQPAAAALDDEAWDKLVWDLAEFIQNFETGFWKGVFPYITAETKAGFGGEQGVEGVREVYVKGNQCFNDMLLALKQGCKKSSAGGVPACDAPPQWLDPSIIYLGARARFIYRQEEQRWVVDYLICGGD